MSASSITREPNRMMGKLAEGAMGGKRVLAMPLHAWQRQRQALRLRLPVVALAAQVIRAMA